MDEDNIDFGKYTRAVSRHWIWALIAFIIVLGIVVAYTFTAKPVYEASNLVLIMNQDQSSFLLGSSAPKLSDLETQKIIIQSASIMSPIYAKYGEDTFTLTANTIKNANVIEIKVDSDSAGRAALIANDIASAYVDYTADMRKQDAEDIITFVNKQIDEYEGQISAIDTDILNYKNISNSSRDQQLAYQQKQRELAAKNKIYDHLLSKREDAALARNINGGGVKILSYAQVPIVPMRPNKPLNLALGAILAVGAAFGCAFLADTQAMKNKAKTK